MPIANTNAVATTAIIISPVVFKNTLLSGNAVDVIVAAVVVINDVMSMFVVGVTVNADNNVVITVVVTTGADNTTTLISYVMCFLPYLLLML